MPNPKAGESKNDFIQRCVSFVMKEGKTQEQALGMCYGIWNSNKTASKERVRKSIEQVKDLLNKAEEDEAVCKYEPELLEVSKAITVEGFKSPEAGDLPEGGAKLLAKVYAKCRKDGGDKEKCAKIAWSAVSNAGYKSESKVVVLKRLENKLSQMLMVRKARAMMPIKEGRDETTDSYFSDLKIPAFMMCPPFNVDNEKKNNVWMENKDTQEPIDYDKAYTQWWDLKKVLDEAGWVYVLPSQWGLQDEVYVANLGIFLPQHIKKDTVVLSNFRSEPRQGEEQVGREFFGLNQWNDIQSPYWFEGEADIKYLRDKVFIAGYGIRSQIETYDWMEKTFGIQVVKVKMTDEFLYHFDTVLFPIDKQNCMVVTEVLDPADVKAIESVANIIPISKAHGYGGTTNCVRAGKLVLNASNLTGMEVTDEKYAQERDRVDEFQKIVMKAELEPVVVNLSEFEKSGASLSCLVFHLNYLDYLR